MRKPEQIERLYLDFDGFFASVEQAARPSLRGLAVGVVPFSGAGDRGCIIACSREAKLADVANIMTVVEARQKCPDLVTIVQSPDLYRRAHNALISEIQCVIPIDEVKSIDEMTCIVEARDRNNPRDLGQRIKARLHANIGPWITCSIGYAANRQLAKMACKAGKRPAPGHYGDGNNAWFPDIMPDPLLDIPLIDVPGIGERMRRRLLGLGIVEMQHVLNLAPKHMRKIWGSVMGERLWYALNGYDVQAPTQERGMYGHGRVLQPQARKPEIAYEIARVLTIKAARRLRFDRWYASRFYLYIGCYNSQSWSCSKSYPAANDDNAGLTLLSELWAKAMETLPRRPVLSSIHICFTELTHSGARQLDMLCDDDTHRKKWEAIATAIDALNMRHGRTLVSVGAWPTKYSDYLGGKISYTRIPNAADFL